MRRSWRSKPTSPSPWSPAGPAPPMLLRKAWADARSLARQAVSLMVLVGLGIALFVGMYQAYQNLDDTYEHLWQTNRFAEASVQFERGPLGLVAKARTLPHVREALGRIVREGSLEQPGREQEHARGRFISVPRNHGPAINGVTVLQGRYLRTAHEVLMEHQFAEENHYELGEVIKCRYGAREREFTVVGFVVSPEYIFLVPSRHEMWVDRKSFAVLFVDETLARDWLGMGRQISELHCLVDEGYQEDVVEKLKGLAQPYGVEYGFVQERQAGTRVLRMDQVSYAIMSVFFPVLFLSSAALTLYGALSRLVRLQASLIGMLKACGFSDRQLLFQQVLVGGLLSVGGAVPGEALGHLMAVGLAKLYAHYLYLPDVVHPFRLDTAAVGLLLAAATGLGAAYFPARVAAKLPPAAAMRGDVDRHGGLGLEQFVLRATQFRSVLFAIPARGLARRLSSTALAVAGIAGGTCILVTTLGLHVSVQDAIGEYLNEARRFDLEVAFTHPQAKEAVEALVAFPGGGSLHQSVTVPVRVRTAWGEGETILMGLERGQQALRFRTVSGGQPEVAPGKLWLPKQLASVLRAERGDPLQVEWVRSSRRRPVDTVMQMAGELDLALGNLAVGDYYDVRRSFADRLFPESAYSAHLSVPDDQREPVKRRLEASPQVAFVSSSADLRQQVEEQMRMMYAFIAVLLCFGGLLAGSSIHSVASVALLERQREMAALLSLGFGTRTIAGLLSVELGLLAAAGLAVGLPLGSVLNTAYLTSFETESASYRPLLPLWVLLLSAAIVFGLVAVSTLMAKRRLRALDLSQATKARE